MTRMESFPFDSKADGYDADGYPVYDRAVGASMLRATFEKFFTDGVFPTPGTALNIGKADTGLAVTVQPGIAIINGAMGGIEGEDPITLTLDTASPQGNVCYGIMLRYDNTDERRSLYFNVVRGDASSTPQPPAPDTTTPEVHEMRLGYVTVPSNSTDLTDATVTNEKGTGVCPFAAPFEEIDMATVIADAKAQAGEYLDSFNVYLAENRELIETAIDGTTAGYLQSQIDALAESSVDLADSVDNSTIEYSTLPDSQGVSKLHVKDGGITSAKLSDGSVGTSKLADGAVGVGKIGSSAVDGESVILDDSGKLAVGDVDSSGLTNLDFIARKMGVMLEESEVYQKLAKKSTVVELDNPGIFDLTADKTEKISTNYSMCVPNGSTSYSGRDFAIGVDETTGNTAVSAAYAYLRDSDRKHYYVFFLSKVTVDGVVTKHSYSRQYASDANNISTLIAKYTVMNPDGSMAAYSAHKSITEAMNDSTVVQKVTAEGVQTVIVGELNGQMNNINSVSSPARSDDGTLTYLAYYQKGDVKSLMRVDITNDGVFSTTQMDTGIQVRNILHNPLDGTEYISFINSADTPVMTIKKQPGQRQVNTDYDISISGDSTANYFSRKITSETYADVAGDTIYDVDGCLYKLSKQGSTINVEAVFPEEFTKMFEFSGGQQGGGSVDFMNLDSGLYSSRGTNAENAGIYAYDYENRIALYRPGERFLSVSLGNTYHKKFTLSGKMAVVSLNLIKSSNAASYNLRILKEQ